MVLYKKGIGRGRRIPRTEAGLTRFDVLVRGVGFFLAMAVPVSGMAPFGMSFLAQERRFSLKAVITLFFVGLGSAVACDRLGAARYIGAGLLYLMLLFVLEKGVKITDVTAAVAAGLCTLLTGAAVLTLRGFSVAELLLLLCEAAVVATGALMMEKSGEVLSRGRLSLMLADGDTKLSLGAVAAISLLSLKKIYMGSDFSVMNFAALLVLLMIASGCGATYSAGAGVVLGLICGIGGDSFLPILGAFSFCGFFTGVFSRFGKGGVIAGIIAANAVLVIYTNNSTEAVLSVFEVVAASVIFAVIPKSRTEAVRELLFAGADEKESIRKLKDALKARLAAVGAAFEAMSGTLDKLSEKASYDNSNDVAVVFDVTADKVCQRCRKAQLCWGRDFNSVYREMFGLLEVLKERGKLADEDIGDELRARCMNIPELINELNHQFDIYRVRSVWKNRMNESRELVGEQLSDMSSIIGSLANELDSNVRSTSISAWEVRSRLESRGIRAQDVKVLRDKNGRYRIEAVVKTAAFKEKHRAAMKKIMKNVLKCHIMKVEEAEEDRKYTRLCFSEGERYTVEAQHACRAASEKNGDSFRLIHLSGGKYVIAISDGMGTGKRAAKESEAILELLDSFLQAGFNTRTAVRLINSIMIMKSEDEAFVTIDLCIIDLYTGEVKFIKTGAEPSFIMQKGGDVETVNASSLPVGIVPEAEADVTLRRVCDGDRIVMITDGVESRENGSRWVSEFIRESCRDEENGDIAKGILDYAVKNNGAPRDDMTVLSVRLKAVG